MYYILYSFKTKTTISIKKGWSPLALVFGFFLPLYHKNYVLFVIMLLSAALTLGISWFIYPFFYNEWYLSFLEHNGYQLIDVERR